MRNFTVLTAALCAVSSPFSLAHQGMTEFGQLETVTPIDYHFHLPVSVDLEGKLTFGIHGLGGHDHAGATTHEDHTGHESDKVLKHGDMGHGGHSDPVDPVEGTGMHDNGAGVEFMPMVRFNWEKIERNVCSQKAALALGDLKVRLATDCAPMWNIQKRSVALGVGAAAHFGWGGVGILPTRDTSVFQKKAVQPGKENETRIEFPTAISDFKDWQTGDYLSYEKSLGLMLHLDAANPIPLLLIGPGAMTAKTWKISLEKASDKTVHAMFTTSKMGTLGAEVGTALAGFGYDLGKMDGTKFHFVFDLDDPRANEAFEFLLKGSIGDVLRMTSESTAVVDLGKEEMKSKVRSSTVSAGVPALFGARSARGEMKTVSVRDGDRRMDSTLIFRERGTQGLLSRHKLAGEYLAGSVEALNGDSFGHFGFVALWSFEKEKLNDTRLERKVNGFLRDLGLSEKATVALPDDSDGYLRGEAKVSFSSASLKSLVNLIQSEKEMTALLLASGLEESEQGMWLRRWKRIASKLRQARKADDALAYSAQITRLGRELIEESSLFRAWIQSVGGVDISVSVLGEKIPESSFRVNALDLL